jgi:hypothetical protein
MAMDAAISAKAAENMMEAIRISGLLNAAILSHPTAAMWENSRRAA